MKDIPAIVQSHMAKRIALYGQEPEQPLVEELFKRYSELQSTNDQAFLDAFQKLYKFMEPLSVDATQQASQVVCDLCSETERMAFIIGLHAGMQFAWEVTEPTEVKLLAEKMNIPFVDTHHWNIELTFDGVHFTEEGHHTFAENLRKELCL